MNKNCKFEIGHNGYSGISESWFARTKKKGGYCLFICLVVVIIKVECVVFIDVQVLFVTLNWLIN